MIFRYQGSPRAGCIKTKTFTSMPLFIKYLVLVGVFCAGPALSQPVTDEDGMMMMRTASAQAATVQFCTTYYIIDTPTAVKMGAAAKEVANKILGKKADRAFSSEMARRLKEVQVTGDVQWCRQRRTVLNENGVRIFLN